MPDQVSCSYLEIYNEMLNDLLNPSSSTAGLQLREDPTSGTVCDNLVKCVRLSCIHCSLIVWRRCVVTSAENATNLLAGDCCLYSQSLGVPSERLTCQAVCTNGVVLPLL